MIILYWPISSSKFYICTGWIFKGTWIEFSSKFINFILANVVFRIRYQQGTPSLSHIIYICLLFNCYIFLYFLCIMLIINSFVIRSIQLVIIIFLLIIKFSSYNAIKPISFMLYRFNFYRILISFLLNCTCNLNKCACKHSYCLFFYVCQYLCKKIVNKWYKCICIV